MKFSRYCRDRWLSVFIFIIVAAAGGGLPLLIGTPLAVAWVVEGFYAAGFFVIILQDYFARKEFYDTLLEQSGSLEEVSYFSEFLSEPSFQEGQILCRILRQDEKYINDRTAAYERELQEYQDYVETWVHEIKTPIAVSRLIMENNRNDSTRSLSREMDKIEGCVEQMLYYRKGSSLQDDYTLRAVPLRELVMGAVKRQAGFMIEEKVTPKFSNLDNIVLTDPKWMGFVLEQIISNAVKYHSKEQPPELVFSAECKGKTVILSIADNGIGILPEDVDRIFRKGFTGENGRKYKKSTGMGLYLCDMLCKKLGTELTVSSMVQEGTVFRVKLAAASKEQVPGMEPN